jgi:hypothetical protein
MKSVSYLNRRVRRAQELDKLGDDTAADDFVDRRVALLGEKLAELCGGTKLVIDIVRHDSLNHSRELLVELQIAQRQISNKNS